MKSDTARDHALAQLGRGPCTRSMLAGSLLQHGRTYPEAIDQARAALDGLVDEKRVERLEVHGADVYRYAAKTPMEADNDPP